MSSSKNRTKQDLDEHTKTTKIIKIILIHIFKVCKHNKISDRVYGEAILRGFIERILSNMHPARQIIKREKWLVKLRSTATVYC